MSPPTNGRMDAYAAVLCWPWRVGSLACAAVEHRIPSTMRPQWIALVQFNTERPEWIPDRAVSYALPNSDDVAFVW